MSHHSQYPAYAAAEAAKSLFNRLLDEIRREIKDTANG